MEIAERALRHAVVYPALKIILRNRVSETPLEIDTIKRVLIFRFDRIGDMIVTTPVFKALKRRNTNLQIDVIASSVNEEIPRSNPFVDEVYVLKRNWRELFAQILELRRRKYDVILNFVFNRTTFPAILANLIAPGGFKVGQGPEKYEFYFNRLLKLPRFEKHMAETLMAFIEQVFGIRVSDEERGLEIEVSEEARVPVERFLRGHGLRSRSLANDQLAPYVLINLSVKDAERRFSNEQVVALARYLAENGQFRIVLLVAPGDQEMEHAARLLPELTGIPVFRALKDRPLAQLASIVEGALCLVTMDTSLVHFASAMQTSVLAFYTELVLVKEWSPYRVPHGILLTPAGKPISGIPTEILISKTKEFIGATFPGGLSAISRSL